MIDFSFSLFPIVKFVGCVSSVTLLRFGLSFWVSSFSNVIVSARSLPQFSGFSFLFATEEIFLRQHMKVGNRQDVRFRLGWF